VNLDIGIAFIRDSKNGQSRHVPMNSEGRRRLNACSLRQTDPAMSDRVCAANTSATRSAGLRKRLNKRASSTSAAPSPAHLRESVEHGGCRPRAGPLRLLHVRVWTKDEDCDEKRSATRSCYGSALSIHSWAQWCFQRVRDLLTIVVNLTVLGYPSTEQRGY